MPETRRRQVVAETQVFSEDADALLSPSERDAVIAAIAGDPSGGDLISGTGGLRKRRVAFGGRGKRGGARVITFYMDEHHPVYALFLYAKNERSDLTSQERTALTKLIADIKQAARTRKRR